MIGRLLKNFLKYGIAAIAEISAMQLFSSTIITSLLNLGMFIVSMNTICIPIRAKMLTITKFTVMI